MNIDNLEITIDNFRNLLHYPVLEIKPKKEEKSETPEEKEKKVETKTSYRAPSGGKEK